MAVKLLDRLRANVARSRVARALTFQKSTVPMTMRRLRREFSTAVEGLRAVSSKWDLQGVTLTLDRGDLFLKDAGGREYLYVPGFGLRHMEFNLTNDRIELEFISHNLPHDAVFLDVGASYGYYGISVASSFPDSTVHCFEPVPRVYEILCRNISRNGLGNVVPVDTAVLDRKAEVSVTIDRFGGDYITGESARHRQEVAGTTLDDYSDEHDLDRVAYIKIDVEGAELLVLRGADRLILRDRPIIQLETTDDFARRFGYTSMEVLDHLLDRGFDYLMLERSELASGVGRPHVGSGERAADLRVATDFFFFPTERPPVVDYASTHVEPLRFPYV